MPDSDPPTPPAPIEDAAERSRYYDDEIAPRLAEVAALCKAQGMPMLAAVYYSGEASGLTALPPAVTSAAWTLLRHAWQARGNIDAMCIALARVVKPEHDGSMALRFFRGSN